MTITGPQGEQRIEPALPAGAYRTFAWRQPRDITVKVACELAGCEAWRSGWETSVDERTDLGLAQATYIRQGSGRTFRELRTGTGLTVFRFSPGQRCFAEHLTRPQRFSEYPGDWRGRAGPVTSHSPDGWADAFGEHQDALKDALERG